MTGPRREWKHYLLTLVSVTLMILLFGSLYLSGVTGQMGWFAGVAAFDFLVILGFALSAPETWT